MPLDMADTKAMQWSAAKGKYDPHNLIHRFRYYRFRYNLSLNDVSKVTGIETYQLAAFERLPHNEVFRATWSEMQEVIDAIEPLV